MIIREKLFSKTLDKNEKIVSKDGIEPPPLSGSGFTDQGGYTKSHHLEK